MPPATHLAYKESVRRAPGSHSIDLIERALVQTAPRTIGNVVVITSGNDSKHSDRSQHYTDQALDSRIIGDRPGGIDAVFYAELLGEPEPTNWVEYVSLQQRVARDAWVPALRWKLSKDFDVVFEDDHIHTEHDPKPVSEIGSVLGG